MREVSAGCNVGFGLCQDFTVASIRYFSYNSRILTFL
jgi:hypothetical protein